jgi:hypothetical protein
MDKDFEEDHLEEAKAQLRILQKEMKNLRRVRKNLDDDLVVSP